MYCNERVGSGRITLDKFHFSVEREKKWNLYKYILTMFHQRKGNNNTFVSSFFSTGDFLIAHFGFNHPPDPTIVE